MFKFLYYNSFNTMSRRERKSSSRSSSSNRKKRSSSGSNEKKQPTRDIDSKVKTEEDQSALTRFIKDKKTIEVLNKKGIKYFFPVQYNTYDIIYKGKDLIARDRTGSGKTMAFSLPIIERFRDEDAFEKARTKFLIVLPTRELSMQVKNEIESIKHKPSEFSVVNVYGGADIWGQIRELKEGADIIVATPGRLLDLLEREHIRLSHLQVVCLDEADEMLKQGFQEDIEKIFQLIQKHGPKKTQNLLFSATIPTWVNEISRKYLSSDREFIDLIKNSEMKTSKTVEHLGINCPYFSRNSVIADVVNLYGGRHGRTIIFTETKKEVNEIILKANLKEARALHGDIPQKEREIAFKSFKDGKLKCLVATNVAARGLDIPEVDLIVQLEPPKDVQTYIHRAGRTGRAGRSGTCIIFYTKAQLSLVQRIERIARIKIKRVGPPQPNDILKASARDIVLSLKQVSQTVLPHFNEIAQQMIEEEGNPVKALSKALAYISGNTQKISQRSLLNSADGFITYILASPVDFNSNGYIFNFLRGFASERFMDEIKGMRKIGNNIAAFDIPETLKEDMDKIESKIKEQEGRTRGYSLKVAESLVDLEDPNEVAKSDKSEDEQINQGDKREAIRRKRDLEIFVGGLPYNADENEVKTFFKDKGVSSVSTRLLRNENGESRGVAFVLCLDDRAVRKALSMDGEKFGSRAIKINLAARN